MPLIDKVKDVLRPVVKPILRRFQTTSMKRVVGELDKRSVPLDRMSALEVFGGDGTFHTLDYARRVANLDIWEFDHEKERSLRRNLPFATVKITDSYHELRETPKTFDLVVVDNPLSTFAKGMWCEHFEVFPDVFRVLKEEAILIINVETVMTPTEMKRVPYIFNAEQLARRKVFYGTDHPDRMTLDELVSFYRGLYAAHGFEIDWHFFVKRPYQHYFVAKVKGRRPTQD